MALSALKKKQGKIYTSSLIAHLYALEQREANTPKRSRRQEVTKLRFVINYIETNNYIKNQKHISKKRKQKTKQNKNKNKQKTLKLFFDKINNIDKPLTRLTRGNRDGIQIKKNRKETGDITKEIEEIKKKSSECTSKAYTQYIRDI